MHILIYAFQHLKMFMGVFFGQQLTMLICDSCDLGYHMVCNKPPLPKKPSGRWECFRCLKSSSMSSTAIAEEAVVASLQQQPNWATPAAAGVPVTRQCRSSQAEAPVSVEIGKVAFIHTSMGFFW